MAKSQVPPAQIVGKTIAGYVSVAFPRDFYRVFLLFTDDTAMEVYSYHGIYFSKSLDSGGPRGIENQIYGGTILGEGFMQGLEVPWQDGGGVQQGRSMKYALTPNSSGAPASAPEHATESDQTIEETATVFGRKLATTYGKLNKLLLAMLLVCVATKSLVAPLTYPTHPSDFLPYLPYIIVVFLVARLVYKGLLDLEISSSSAEKVAFLAFILSVVFVVMRGDSYWIPALAGWTLALYVSRRLALALKGLGWSPGAFGARPPISSTETPSAGSRPNRSRGNSHRG